jgi:hypothetical protein
MLRLSPRPARFLGSFVILVAVMSVLAGCYDPVGNRITGMDLLSGDDADETATSPNNITGAYLSCKEITRAISMAKVGCNILSSSNKVINADTQWKSVDWQAVTVDASVSYNVQKNRDGYHAIYQFTVADGSTRTVDDSQILAQAIGWDNSRLLFKYELMRREAALSYKRFVRLVLTSIHSAEDYPGANVPPPAPGQPSIIIEQKLNDEWIPIKFSVLKGLTVGKYPIKVDANLSDLQMFNQILNGAGITAIPPNCSFTVAPPHDVKEKPVTFTVDFGADQVKVGLWRFNRGEVIPMSQRQTGTFDKYHMEVSSDGVNWKVVKETIYDFEKNPEMLDFDWDKVLTEPL